MLLPPGKDARAGRAIAIPGPGMRSMQRSGPDGLPPYGPWPSRPGLASMQPMPLRGFDLGLQAPAELAQPYPRPRRTDEAGAIAGFRKDRFRPVAPRLARPENGPWPRRRPSWPRESAPAAPTECLDSTLRVLLPRARGLDERYVGRGDRPSPPRPTSLTVHRQSPGSAWPGPD